MEFYAASLNAARGRQRTTPEPAWGRVERGSGLAPLSGGERRGLPPRPPVEPLAGCPGEACREGRGGVRNEREAVAAAGAGSGRSAADGRRGEGGGVDGRGNAELEARGGVPRSGAAVVCAGAGAAGEGGALDSPGSVVAREAGRGGSEVGTKRLLPQPPVHHPPPKRTALSARRRFPPGCGRDAVAPLGRADGGSRFRAARPDDTLDALDKAVAAPRPPLALAGCNDVVLPRAESVCSPCASGKGGRHVPAARQLAKRRMVSARRSFPPGCGRVAGPLLSVEVGLMLDSGLAADGGLGVPEKMDADGDCSAADEGGTEVMDTPCDGAIDEAVQDKGLEEGEILTAKVHPVPQEHLGYQVSVYATLHQPVACGQGAFAQSIGAVKASVNPSSDEKISGSRIQCGEKRVSCQVAKDFKVMNSSAWSSYRVSDEFLSEGPSQEQLKGNRVSAIAKMDKASSDFAVRGSGEGATMRSKVTLTPRKTVRPPKVIKKSAADTQHTPLSENKVKNDLGSHETKNEIEDTHDFTKRPVQRVHTSSEKRLMTQGNEVATVTGYFGPRKKVKVKDPAYLPIKLNLKFELGSKEKLDAKADSNLDGDDLLKGLAVREGKLELCLKDSLPFHSMKHQRQHGVQNADARSKIKMMCRRFEIICRTIAQAVDQRSLKVRRIDLAADKAMKELPDYSKPGPFVGKVPGVEVGDGFLYRVQLAIVGLHRPYQGGIDWTKDNSDNLIAISVVASGGYPDQLSSSGELVYTGSGGKLAGRNASGDQKLERGNIALKNCIERKSPVRVIHGFKGQNNEEGSHSRAKEITTFTYDGLYHVVDCWREGQPGSKLFKFRLQRIPGQPELSRGRKTGIMI